MACWQTSIEVLQNGKVYVESGSRSNSYYGKFWVARISGMDEKFGFIREFINDKEGAICQPGIYQIFRDCQWAKRPENYFIKVVDGDYEIISKTKVLELFS